MKESRSTRHRQLVSGKSETDGYGRYPRYTVLIICWGITVAAYVIVLEKAVGNHDYLGAQGSKFRSRSFDVLGFFRTGLATIHVPVVITVLASTVPYWTMIPESEQYKASDNPLDEHVNVEVDESSSVIQLFYLADRTWAGLIGWTTTWYNGVEVRRPSIAWIHLALVAAVSYIGFPLLSVAYVVQSTQYWDSQQIPATVSIGGLESSYEDAMAAMRQTNLWVANGSFVSPPNIGNLHVYNSSQQGPALNDNITRVPTWALGNNILTLPLFASGNAQVSTVAIQISASCSKAGYNNTIYVPSQSNGTEFGLDFNFEEVNPNDNAGLPYKLSCKKICNSTLDERNPTCFSNSSTLKMWPSDDQRRGLGKPKGDLFTAAGPSFTGQTLSCITIRNSLYLESLASIQLAVQGPGSWTAVRSCNVSVSYSRPTVNTLIGEFMQATLTASSSSSLLEINGITPDQLLALSIISPLYLFHNGPPPAAKKAQAATDGFKWISWVSDSGSKQIQATLFQPGTLWLDFNPFDMLYSIKLLESEPDYPDPDMWYNPDDQGEDYKLGQINETAFLKPLASIISKPEFFGNGTTVGVAFKTEIEMVHGKVPPALAIFVLMLPIIWTLALSLLANRYKRWTSSLDALAIFKLGGDWYANFEGFRLADLSGMKYELGDIPGMVSVDAELNVVELAYPRKKREVKGQDNRGEEKGEEMDMRKQREKIPESWIGKRSSVSGVMEIKQSQPAVVRMVNTDTIREIRRIER